MFLAKRLNYDRKGYKKLYNNYSNSGRRSGGSSYKSNSRGGSGGGRSRGGFRRKPSNLDSRRFINTAVPITAETTEAPQHSFADFNFHEQLARNIEAKGYKVPTPIQDKVIKPLLAGNDLVGLANTGTGKTAAFMLPIIHGLATNKKRNAALVIAPTRELAHQVNDEFREFAKGMKLFSVVCVGGENIHRQKSELRRGVNIIVGTPGRLKDLIEQGELKLHETTTLVLDEADQMLDMGFLPDMQFIMHAMPEKKQVVCFSATMTTEVTRLLDGIQNNAVMISTAAKVTSEHIDQNIIESGSKEQKVEKLVKLLAEPQFDRVLIFGETKFGVQRLADDLTRKGHSAEAIHGNKSQSQRQRALKSFKDARVKVLVATDVAARGLDIPDVSLVVNFDQPQTYDTYIHRIGRTGRAGKGGTARTFVS